jgi:hypothetical protein
VRAELPTGDNGQAKRSTAIGHLVEMADVATEQLRLRDMNIGWPLEELWVTGEVLGPIDALYAGSVVLVLDLPADELPCLALHRSASGPADISGLASGRRFGVTGRWPGRHGTTSADAWCVSGLPATASTPR